MLEEYSQKIRIDVDTTEAMNDIKNMTKVIDSINDSGIDIDMSGLEKSLADAEIKTLRFEAALKQIGELESFKEKLLPLNTVEAHQSMQVIDERLDSLKKETEETQKQNDMHEESLAQLAMYKQLEDDIRKLGLDNDLSKEILDAETEKIKLAEQRQKIEEDIAAKELLISRLRGVGTPEAKAEQRRLEDEIAKLKKDNGMYESSKDIFSNAFSANSFVGRKAEAIMADPKGTLVRGAGKVTAQLLDSVAGQLASVFTVGTQQLKSMFLGSWDSLDDVLKSAFDEFDEIVSSSFLTNDTTWNNVNEYGMSASQSYGFEKAKMMLGVSDDSLERMTDSQRQIFNDLFKKYQGKYDDLYDSGFFDKMMTYNIEAQEFQEDLKLEVVGFLVNNKDLIKKTLEGLLHLAEKILNGASWLFGTKENKAATAMSDAAQTLFSDISNVTNSSNIDNRQTKIDNTFTFNTQSVDAQSIQNIPSTYWSTLAAQLYS